MSTELQLVTFHGDTLFLIDRDNQPYTPVKQFVENLGLAWQVQHRKLVSSPRYGCITIKVMQPGDIQQRDLLCLPLHKLPAFLYSIDSRKCKPEVRAKVEQYQAECDDVLWDYWFKSHASNPHQMVIAPPEPETITYTKDEFLELQAERIDLLKIKIDYLELKSATQPRRRLFTDAEKREIYRLAATGLTPTQIGKRLGRTDSVIAALLRRRLNP